MNGPAAALVAGLVAGFAIVLPIGPIAVLILQEGLSRGLRSGIAAGTGTALVDLGYVTLALSAGAAVSAPLRGYTRPIQLVGAVVLVAVAVRGLLALRRTSLPFGPGARRDGPPLATAPAAQGGAGTGTRADAGAGPGTDPGTGSAPGPGTALATDVAGPAFPFRTLRRFVGLTVINPLTAVFFVVLAAGLGEVVHGTAAAVAFATGVFVASWSWQVLLAATGALAGARLPEWARTATSLAGYLVVLGYAGRLALG